MTKKNPLVSVLIPSYNHESYIRESIESVWAQDWENLELIIADDGSKDNSAKIIESMLASSPISMKFLKLEHGGLIKTLNKAFDASSGEFIALLASDDKFKINKISCHLQQMLNDEEIVLSHSDVCVLDENGLPSDLDVSSRGNPAHGYVGLDVLLGRTYIRYSPVMRRESLIQVGVFDEKYALEDWPLYLKMAHLGKIGYLNQKLTERRVHGLNWSTVSAKKPDLEFKNAALDLIESFSPTPAIFEQAATTHMCSSLRGTLYQGDFKGGWNLAKAIKHKFPDQSRIINKNFVLGIASHVWGRHLKPWLPTRIQKLVVSLKDKLIAN